MRVGNGILVPYIAIVTIPPSTIQIFSSTFLGILIGSYKSIISLLIGKLFLSFMLKKEEGRSKKEEVRRKK
ncbi:MAG: hypothetical protein F6K17_36930 [Okeania sp. SIO3C4]|nr:hypothetical protein [Okeania sp. SIO3C4]